MVGPGNRCLGLPNRMRQHIALPVVLAAQQREVELAHVDHPDLVRPLMRSIRVGSCERVHEMMAGRVRMTLNDGDVPRPGRHPICRK